MVDVETQFGHRALAGSAPSQAHGATLVRCRRNGSADVDLDRLGYSLSRLYRVGIATRKRPHVGFEGCIGPVAVILHFENLAAEADLDLQIRCGAVRKAHDVPRRLIGLDQSREHRNGGAAVRVPDRQGSAYDTLERVEHDEAGSIRSEAVDGTTRREHPEVAVRLSLDPDGVGKVAVLAHDRAIVGNLEAPRLFTEGQPGQDRTIGAPARVPEHEGDASQDLQAAPSDVPQRARAERHRKVAGTKPSRRFDRLIGAEEEMGPAS